MFLLKLMLSYKEKDKFMGIKLEFHMIRYQYLMEGRGGLVIECVCVLHFATLPYQTVSYII